MRRVSRVVFILALMALVALPLRAAERTIEKVFPVGASVRIKIDCFAGTVVVSRGEADQVKFLVHEEISGAEGATAERTMDGLELTWADEPGVVALRARYRSSVRWSWAKWPPVGLEVKMTVPEHCAVEIWSHDSKIEVGDLAIDLAVHADQSAVALREITGEVSVDGMPGDIAVTACTGSLKLYPRAGNVMVGRMSGSLEIAGDAGEIEVGSLRGVAKIRVDKAAVRIGFAYPIVGDAELNVSGGDVRLTFDSRCAARLDVQAWPWGKVHWRDLDPRVLKGGQGADQLQAELNGGGPTVSVRCSGGTVRLGGVPPM